VRGLKLAVFTNAHVMPAAVRAAIAAKLEQRNVTLVYLYAAGVIDARSGRADPAGMDNATGLPAGALRVGEGARGALDGADQFGAGDRCFRGHVLI
jgi:hypothetical protein